MRRTWKSRGLTVGLANGCFDMLHRGHVHLVREAEEACDRLVLAINSDDSVRRMKGDKRPVQPQFDRAAVVSALSGVAAVIIFNEDTPLELILKLVPDVLIKGSDYSQDTVVGAEFVRQEGGRVKIVERLPLYSTSAQSGRI